MYLLLFILPLISILFSTRLIGKLSPKISILNSTIVLLILFISFYEGTD
jgi:hypothetical protein